MSEENSGESENERSENGEDEIHGDVDTIDGDDTTDVDAGDTTVTIETSAPSGDVVDAAVVEAAIDTAREQGEQSAQLDQLAQTVAELAGAVESLGYRLDALAAAEVATVEAVESIAEDDDDGAGDDDESDDESGDAEPVAEDRSEPRSAGAHPMFRSWADWRRK